MTQGMRRGRAVTDEALWALERLLRDRAEVEVLLERARALQLVAERVREATGADAGFVGSVEAGDTMVVRHWSGTRGPSLHDLEVPAGLGVGGRVLLSTRAVVVDDYLAAASITHHFDAPVRDEGLRALAAVPIVVGGRVEGVVYAGRRGSAGFGDVAVDALREVSRGASLTLGLQAAVDSSTSARVSDERRDLAVRLHDSVGARLFGIGASVRDLRSTDGTSPALHARLSRLEEQVAEAARELREALAALGGAADERPLAAALHADCRAFEARTGVRARFVALCDAPDLGTARQQALRRVVREALLNVEKHARAGSVVVSLAALDDGVAVIVADDGVGITSAGAGGPRATPPGTALGLASLRDDLDRVAGNLSVVDGEDCGTTLRAWVPCL